MRTHNCCTFSTPNLPYKSTALSCPYSNRNVKPVSENSIVSVCGYFWPVTATLKIFILLKIVFRIISEEMSVFCNMNKARRISRVTRTLHQRLADSTFLRFVASVQQPAVSAYKSAVTSAPLVPHSRASPSLLDEQSPCVHPQHRPKTPVPTASNDSYWGVYRCWSRYARN